MRYAIISCVALAACMAVGWLVVRAVASRRGRALPHLVAITLSIPCGVALMALFTAAYLGAYYHAAPEALAALEGSPDVEVTREPDVVRFDGPGTRRALVFLPGAKVQPESYAPLMLRLAERGVDCFLMCPPMRLAPLALGAVERVMGWGSYEDWALAGHSLGGVTASSFVASRPGAFRALILLAAYPTSEVPHDVALLSVVGSEDMVLERGPYEQGRASLWPPEATELVIEGGNHAGFGCYGAQSGDGEARISAAEEQEQTAQAIVALAWRAGEDGSPDGE